jgi:RNA polymerase sigma factor (sigma-70 family)
MGAKYWSKELIIDTLIEIYKKGNSLSSVKLPSKLVSAINYKTRNKKKYFDSIIDAREEAAKKLEQENDFTGAEEIRKYNTEDSIYHRLPKEGWEKRKDILAEKLKLKIEKKEDVSFRAQKKSDSYFLSMSIKVFGTYKGVFDYAKIEYNNFCKNDLTQNEVFLDQLIDEFILKKKDLDKSSVEKENPELVRKLDIRFGKYYHGLEAAVEKALKKGLIKESEKPDINYWREKRFKEVIEERKKEAQERRAAQKNIILIDRDEDYTPEEIGFLTICKTISGKEIFSLLKNSEDWIDSRELSLILNCTTGNINKNLTRIYSDKTVKYKEGKKFKFFFSKEILEEYKKRNFKIIPENSLTKIAEQLGVRYSKIRSILQKRGIELSANNKKENCRILSKKEISLVKKILDEENAILENAKKNINPEKLYTLGDLEKIRAYWQYFNNEIKRGNIETIEINSKKYIKGSIVLENLNKETYEFTRTQPLSVVSFLHPKLYSVSELIPIIKKTRGTIRWRLKKLLKENPDCCFRLKKNENYSKILVTEELLPFLKNWNLRPELNLLYSIDKIKYFSDEETIKKSIQNLECIIEKENISYDLNKKLFEELESLKNYASEVIQIKNSEISIKDLISIKDYMKRYNFKFLELSEKISLEELEEHIPNSNFLEKVIEIKDKTETAIYVASLPLIKKVAKDMGLLKYFFSEKIFKKGKKSGTLQDFGNDALFLSVKKFDSLKGEFYNYAYTNIKYYFLNALNKKLNKEIKTISLSKPIFDENELIDFVEDQKIEKSDSKIIETELSNRINEILSDLTEKEKDIITRNFGLGGKDKETLEQIGKHHNLTRERIRQIQEIALKKLKNKKEIQNLFSEYFIE